jgi:pilus assembly protein Flp/PilA
MKKIMSFFRDEEGATAVEYGIMVAGIAVLILATVFILGGSLDALFAQVNACITGGVC